MARKNTRSVMDSSCGSLRMKDNASEGVIRSGRVPFFKLFNATYKAIFTGSPHYCRGATYILEINLVSTGMSYRRGGDLHATSSLKDGEKERGERYRIFLRIILDEAQCIRSDLNVPHREEPMRSQYTKFKVRLAHPVKGEHSDGGENSDDTKFWVSECESVDDLDDEAINIKIANGWQCKHWPALIRHNGKRPTGLERKDRKKVDGKMIVLDVPPPFDDDPLERKDRTKINGRTVVKDVPALFDENPYDLYHPDNLNSIKCLSTVAFRHYTARHLIKSQMEDVDGRIVAERVKKILEMLVLSKKPIQHSR
ncbi:hypothetical protein BKA58DRAFT_423478 [Alternaria rosae]|uniref:uncharacterized protein n=1 Tax=Alternaria rosae TaxID=1187941 RepID=UPI001E8E8E88|nr:uncharacterized protein BKA58DRAFT_423478 [Alternaria rosae]KAH6865014.1 hypothetical protein BKA58DRAFT_423478 [Alternaria rosae]